MSRRQNTPIGARGITHKLRADIWKPTSRPYLKDALGLRDRREPGLGPDKLKPFRAPLVSPRR
jgi:hypothetical protein